MTMNPLADLDPDDLKAAGGLLADLAERCEQPARSALNTVAVALLEESLRQKRVLADISEQLDGLGE